MGPLELRIRGRDETKGDTSRMAKSPEEMKAAMVKNLAANTGKTLDAWVKGTSIVR